MTEAAATSRPTSDAAAWTLNGLIVLAIALLQWRSPVGIEPAGLQALVLACTALTAASFFYSRVRMRPHFAASCVGLMQVLLFSAVGSILSYLLAREGGALWDATFSQWDRSIGFDWLAYVRYVDERPWLTIPLRAAYGSLIPQMIVLVVALGFTLQSAKLRATLLAAILCGTITVLLSPLFPAVSNYVYLGLTAADFRNVDPLAGYVHLAHYNALRDGSIAQLNLAKMQGIITFPSYHGGLATVTLWAFWTSGLKWLRWPGAAVAAATIVATPVDGGHYLVDVLAGMALAVASITAAKRLIYWRGVPLPVRALPFRRSHAAFAP